MTTTQLILSQEDTHLELATICYNGVRIVSPRLSRDTDLRQARRHRDTVRAYLRLTGQTRPTPAKEG